MNRCRDCRHWGTTAISSLPDPKNPGVWMMFLHSPTVSDRDDVLDCNKINASPLTETVGEPCGDQGTIMTMADFGCVLWEPHVENR